MPIGVHRETVSDISVLCLRAPQLAGISPIDGFVRRFIPPIGVTTMCC